MYSIFACSVLRQEVRSLSTTNLIYKQIKPNPSCNAILNPSSDLIPFYKKRNYINIVLCLLDN